MENWVEFNRKYSEAWPVLVTRRDPLPEAEARDGEPGQPWTSNDALVDCVTDRRRDVAPRPAIADSHVTPC